MIDKFYMWLAWKLPRALVAWAAIRVFAHASQHYSNKEMGALTPADCLTAWGKQ